MIHVEIAQQVADARRAFDEGQRVLDDDAVTKSAVAERMYDFHVREGHLEDVRDAFFWEETGVLLLLLSFQLDNCFFFFFFFFFFFLLSALC